jgi:hypothetical protein
VGETMTLDKIRQALRDGRPLSSDERAVLLALIDEQQAWRALDASWEPITPGAQISKVETCPQKDETDKAVKVLRRAREVFDRTLNEEDVPIALGKVIKS